MPTTSTWRCTLLFINGRHIEIVAFNSFNEAKRFGREMMVSGAVENYDDGIDLIAPRHIDRIQIRKEPAE